MNRNNELEKQRTWLPAGTIVGNYVIRERLAASGTGEVYLVKDRLRQREAALKLLPAPPGYHAEQLQTLARQIQAQAPPRHPHICELYETGVTADGQLFVVSEYVNGQSLDALSQAGAPLNVPKIAAQTAAALYAAHARGALHTDLKLANLMLTRHSHVKVLDFGLAAFKSLWQPLGKNGVPLAHVRPSGIRHFSPEHVNRAPLTRQSDLFSLGALLYELLTGMAPFTGASLYEMCAAITCEQPYPITAYAPCTPPPLCAAIGRLLAKDLCDRTASAQALLVELQQACAPAGKRAADLLQPAGSAPPVNADDWRMVGSFGIGVWQLAFSGAPFAIGVCVVAMSALWMLSSMLTSLGIKH